MQILQTGDRRRSLYNGIRRGISQYLGMFKNKKKYIGSGYTRYRAGTLFKMRALKEKGFMTVEASVIVPVILFIAVSLIMMFFYLYEREYLRSEIYERAYSVPYYSIRSDAEIMAYLNGLQPQDVYMFGSVDSEAVSFMGQISFRGIVDYKVKDDFYIKREVGKVTERLRRWQLYESLAEE